MQAVTRRILNDAMRGDLSALEKLEDLCYDIPGLVEQSLLVVSRHLRAPTPTRPPRQPSIVPTRVEDSELGALLALGILEIGSSVDKDGGPYPVHTAMMAQMGNILRWMTHLFSFWVLDQSHRTEIPDFLNETQPTNVVVNPMPSRVQSVVPALLEKMSGHPKISVLLRDAAKAGTLISHMFIVAARERDFDILLSSRRAAGVMAQHGGDPPAEIAFFSDLKRHQDIFAQGVVPWIGDLANEPHSHLVELTGLLPHLVTCVVIQNGLLDACLEQDGLIRAATSIFVSLTGLKPTSDDQDDSILPPHREEMAVIVAAGHILWMGINHGGPCFARIALDGRVLDALLHLLKTFHVENQALETPDDEDCDDTFATIACEILTLTIYPSVHQSAKNFHIMHEYARTDPPSRFSTLQAALGNLGAKLREEAVQLAYLRVASPIFKGNPYKFCDNTKCSSLEDRPRLGRCSSCLSGLYCSRSCQKVAWQNGHRQECKIITSSLLGKGKGFPPTLAFHDREYFTRTLKSRFRYYRNICAKDPPTNNTIVHIDLTVFPVTMEYSDRNDAESGSATSGPLLRAKYPTCEKLDGFVEIEVSGLLLE